MLKILNLLPFTVVGWILCGLIMSYSLELFGETTALTIHAIFGPAAFVAVSLWYFRLKDHLHPLQAAFINGALVFLFDLVIVAMILGQGFDMFRSFVGLWLPLMLIVLMTWAAGHFVITGEDETVPPVPSNLAP